MSTDHTDKAPALPALIEAAQALDNFAWSSITHIDAPEALQYLQQLLNNLRAALAAKEPALPPDDPVAPEIVKEAQIRAQRAHPPQEPALRAKPCEWEPNGDTDWADKHYGFYISFEADDDRPYYAAWGEGDGESFATLSEAKDWCQAEVDRWVRTYAVAAPQEPAAQVFGLPFAEAKKRILDMSESDVRGLAISLLIQANGARPPALLDEADARRQEALMKFYAVDSLAALIDAQARHIEKLQAKLPPTPSLASQRVREG